MNSLSWGQQALFWFFALSLGGAALGVGVRQVREAIKRR